MEAENRMMVNRDGEVEENWRWRFWSKGKKLQLHRMNRSRDLMHSMMTIVNNPILSTGNLLRL